MCNPETGEEFVNACIMLCRVGSGVSPVSCDTITTAAPSTAPTQLPTSMPSASPTSGTTVVPEINASYIDLVTEPTVFDGFSGSQVCPLLSPFFGKSRSLVFFRIWTVYHLAKSFVMCRRLPTSRE